MITTIQQVSEWVQELTDTIPEEVAPTSRLDDMGLTDVDREDLVNKAEEHYRVVLSREAVMKAVTVADVAEHIERMLYELDRHRNDDI